MTTEESLFPVDDPDFDVPPLEEPEPDPVAPSPRPAKEPDSETSDAPEPPRPVNWNILTAAEAQVEWLELNAFVNWLRHEFGLSVNVVPPFWHRHPELVWPLSALRQHYLKCLRREAARLGSVRLVARLLGLPAAPARRGDRVRHEAQHRPADAAGRVAG